MAIIDTLIVIAIVLVVFFATPPVIAFVRVARSKLTGSSSRRSDQAPVYHPVQWYRVTVERWVLYWIEWEARHRD